MPRKTLIQYRNGTYNEWDIANTTVLASGEPGFITNLNVLKIGDGTKQWADLPALNDNLTTIVRNDTGSTIPKMSVVYLSGAQGDIPRIVLSIANSEATSSKTYGIVVNDISNGSVGQVIVDGTLKNLNTLSSFSGVNPGTILWLSPTVSGGITTTKPYAPNHIVSVGTLVRVHQTQGVINVKVQNGFELEELHNVATTGATNGQFLQYNSDSGLWVPSSSGNFTSIITSSISGADPLNISSSTASMIINDSTIFLNNDTWVEANLRLPNQTPDTLAVFDNNQNIVSLISPSLTELSYLSGITSNVQTQLNSKQSTLTNPVTGTGVSGYLSKWINDNSISSSLIYDNNTNIGIGTINPSCRLHVIGSGFFSSGITVNSGSLNSPSISFSGNISTGFYSPAVNGISIATSGVDRLHVNGLGNVGINTTVPQNGFKLDVNGNMIARGSIQLNNIITGFAADYSVTRYQFSNSLAGGGANRSWVCNGGGSFGVGFTAPSGLVAISGGVAIGSSYNFTPPTDGLIVQGNVGIGTTNPAEALEVSGALKFVNCSSRLQRYDNSSIALSGNTNGHFGIALGNYNTLGRVFRLASYADGTNAGSFRLRDDTGGADRLIISSAGNLGINADPADRIHVSGSQTTIRLNNSLGYDTQLRLIDSVSDWSVGVNTSNNAGSGYFNIRSNTAGSHRMVIDTSGNVGIGTTNPGYRLQVNGSFGATTKSFRIDHPSKNGYSLEYGSLESPYHGVRLTGRGKVIKGAGSVILPDYLKDLIHDDDTLNIQITNYKHAKTIYVDKIDLKNDKFIVKANRAKTLGELEFFWTLTGVRKDVESLVVEKEN